MSKNRRIFLSVTLLMSASMSIIADENAAPTGEEKIVTMLEQKASKADKWRRGFRIPADPFMIYAEYIAEREQNGPHAGMKKLLKLSQEEIDNEIARHNIISPKVIEVMEQNSFYERIKNNENYKLLVQETEKTAHEINNSRWSGYNNGEDFNNALLLYVQANNGLIDRESTKNIITRVRDVSVKLFDIILDSVDPIYDASENHPFTAQDAYMTAMLMAISDLTGRALQILEQKENDEVAAQTTQNN